MTRKIPMRKCVVTHEQHPKKDLVRVVLTPEKTVEVDTTGRLNGRGAYLLLDKEVILKAQKTGALNRSLKTQVQEEVYDKLLKLAGD
ncbi:MAG: YlxR family protein [Erysipelothrix sp.]|nr:YlxR family protein [Erysipelothrix sp.]